MGEAHDPGEGGPSTPEGMIGDLGRLAPAPPTTLLVHSREIRAHAWAPDLERAIVSVLSGWDRFMPRELVHPIRDVDWVLMAGDLVLGRTDDDLYVARYAMAEPRAREVEKALAARFGGASPLSLPGASAFTATVDGAERAYVRVAPALLAIVPRASASAAAERLARATVPERPRPGELARIAMRRDGGFPGLPPEIRELRAWLSPAGERVALGVEGITSTDDAARVALDGLTRRLEAVRRQRIARIAVGAALASVTLSRDGRVVRARALLERDELRRLVALQCARTSACPDEPAP